MEKKSINFANHPKSSGKKIKAYKVSKKSDFQLLKPKNPNQSRVLRGHIFPWTWLRILGALDQAYVLDKKDIIEIEARPSLVERGEPLY